MKKNRNKLTLVLIVAVLIISIGYAVLTTVFNVNSSVSLSKISFNVHFDNVVVSDDNKAEVTEGNGARITNEAKTEITFAVSLKKLGDYYSFTTDIVNEGSIPGKIKSINLNGLTDSQKKFLKYDVYYSDSARDIKPGDYIGPESSKNITFDLTYDLDDDISNDDMPTDDITVQCTLAIEMENGTLNEYRSRAASNRLMQDEEWFPTSMLHFDRPANAEELQGVYRLEGTEEDDFPIYFYRGGHETVHNHVIFANYCWRIIRTTNTGGIKIIYNGTPTEDGKCINTIGDESKLGDHSYSFNNWNWSDSAIKDYLSTWYFTNIISYQAFLEDTPFCNDHQYTNGRIELDCDDEYRVSVSNGKNNYPVALITAEEVNLCGVTTSGSDFPWLSTDYTYWTMTGFDYRNNAWYLYPRSRLDNYAYVDNSISRAFGVRPVVSLNSDVSFDEGDGTSDNPYIASLS